MKQQIAEAPMTMTHTSNIEVTNDEILDRYKRMQALLQGTRGNGQLVQNVKLYPVWIGDSDHFWYDKMLKTGKEYRLVDARELTNTSAFNHKALAQVLTEAIGEEVNHSNLPITVENIELSPRVVSFTAFGGDWQYNDNTGRLEKHEPVEASAWQTSPDGKQAVFSRDHNIWLRDIESGTERSLTHDGEALFEYVNAGSLQARWSPDSSKLFVVQTDRRYIQPLPMIDYSPSDGSIRPKVDTTAFLVPYRGDAVPTHCLKVIDVKSGKITSPVYPALSESYDTFIVGFFHAKGTRRMSSDRAWWSKDSRYSYFIDIPRGDKSVSVVEFNVNTGETRTLFTETTETYIRQKPDVEMGAIHIPLPETEELIWFSERSGWGHLYLYDMKTGAVKRSLTSGDWLVRDILYVDAKRRELLIQTSGQVAGRDPYYKDIVQVNMDNCKLVPLVESNHNHLCHGRVIDYMSFEGIENVAVNVQGVSPTGNYLVSTQSRVDDTPVSLLFDRSGKQVMTLETADLSALPDNWHWPERVKLKAADGQTDIYGTLYRPSDFDSAKKYPIVEFHYPNPGYAWAPKEGFTGTFDKSMRAHAELGFITVCIDGRGTPCRSKAFLDDSYGFYASTSNINDRVTCIKQLAERYPYMDINRVGIVGIRGSGPLYALLEKPGFYKVGITFNMQDSRLYFSYLAERFEGVTQTSNDMKRHYSQNLDKLKGKLLLIHAMGNPATEVDHSLRLVEKLSEASKEFEMLILKGENGVLPPYAWHRRMDYLVRHLLEVEPPKEFKLNIPPIF